MMMIEYRKRHCTERKTHRAPHNPSPRMEPDVDEECEDTQGRRNTAKRPKRTKTAAAAAPLRFSEPKNRSTARQMNTRTAERAEKKTKENIKQLFNLNTWKNRPCVLDHVDSQ